MLFATALGLALSFCPFSSTNPFLNPMQWRPGKNPVWIFRKAARAADPSKMERLKWNCVTGFTNKGAYNFHFTTEYFGKHTANKQPYEL